MKPPLSQFPIQSGGVFAPAQTTVLSSINMDLDESLDAESQWVAFKHPMEESLVAVSYKVTFQNASSINKAELQRAKKLMKVEEEPQEDTQNQFLEVGKWRKNKESALSQEMASVRNEVQMGMTNTKINASQKSIREKEREREKDQVIADESICPDEQHKEEEDIEDQTMQGDEQQQSQEEQQDEQQQEQEEEEQEEEEQQEEEQQQGQDQQQEEQEQSGAQQQQKRESLQEYDDDKTDTQSQMKRTQYLPSKWTKKSQTNSSLSQWQRKEAILKRILLLVK